MKVIYREYFLCTTVLLRPAKVGWVILLLNAQWCKKITCSKPSHRRKGLIHPIPLFRISLRHKGRCSDFTKGKHLKTTRLWTLVQSESIPVLPYSGTTDRMAFRYALFSLEKLFSVITEFLLLLLSFTLHYIQNIHMFCLTPFKYSDMLEDNMVPISGAYRLS